MPTILNNFELLLIAFVLLMVLIVTTVGLASHYVRAWRNTPLAADDADLETRIQQKKEQVADLDSQITEREKNLRERENAEADVRYLEGRLDEIKAEIVALEDGRTQVAEFEAELQDLIQQLAEKSDELEEKRHACIEQETRAEAAERRADTAESRFEGLKEREDELRREIVKLQEQADESRTLRRELSELRDSVREIERDRVRLEAEKTRLETMLGDLQQQFSAAQEQRAELEKVQEELRDAHAERNRLRGEVADKQDTLQRQEARLAQIQQEIERLRLKRGSDLKEETDDRILADLLKLPPYLDTPALQSKRALRPEIDALRAVQTYLGENGLIFDNVTLNAFHTALKIGDVSPLTVLAGISGTGKSQLPRRYAEAMGMHFLQVAVQPRWDSPQDLLGFYNYIESGYRATELAQAMVHLDRFNWPEESERFRDRMLLVLLDEMNLARVEYYFSEFLSRLEARPPEKEVNSEAKRAAAQITIDIRSAVQTTPYQVFPGHNILFAGTMNEDESTQALSEKVLDRANVLYFSRPRDFNPAPLDLEVKAPEDWISHRSWRSWVKGMDSLEGAAKDKVRAVISGPNGLSEVMAACGRAFGHRLYQAITSYVANYPGEHGPDIIQALSDQVETRILPRLRGLEVDPNQQGLNLLVDLVRDQIQDEGLASAINNAIQRSTHTGLFVWRGKEN